MLSRLPFAALASLAATLALAGCNSSAPGPTAEISATPTASATAPAGVVLSDAEVRLPAVEGRPGAAYFTISSTTARKIVEVSVAGAGSAEMHETTRTNGAMAMAKIAELTLAPNEPAMFKSGGRHVMLFDVDPALAAGSSTLLTLTFENGETATIPATVVNAGGATTPAAASASSAAPASRPASPARPAASASARPPLKAPSPAPATTSSAPAPVDHGTMDHDMSGHDMEGMAH